MKCPHCEYEHDAIDDYEPSVHGEFGGFYHLPLRLERTENAYYDSLQRIALYACPSCMKTFVEG